MYAISNYMFERSGFLRRVVNRTFYQYLARLDRRGEVTLMNYGYAEPQAESVALCSADEANRYSLQLYHKVASAIDLTGLDVLEVGSGRGGGAAYVSECLHPRSMTGVDYSAEAVAFCQRTHTRPDLRYVHGDAEDLPFDDASFDAVINVESSHCYGSMPRFLAEVWRVLRPGGHLLWTDHRKPEQFPALYTDISAAGFTVLHEETITPNVLAALLHQGERSKALIDRRVPPGVRRIFYNFAGVEGTHIYNKLAADHLRYVHLVVRKVL